MQLQRTKGLLFIGALLCLLACGQTWAYDHQLQVWQYQHRAWLRKDGAPSPIRAIAQSPDGYLWLGSEEGLVRFDGQQFDPIATPGGTEPGKPVIAALLAQPDGGLWVGFRRGGGLGQLKDGVFKRIDATLGKDVQFIGEDGQGAVWFLANSSLYRLSGKTPIPIDASWNLPGDVHRVGIDRAGTVWTIDTQATLRYLPAGERRFVQLNAPFEGADVAVDHQGGFWATSVLGAVHAWRDGDGTMKSKSGPSNLQFGTIFFDRDGGLWAQRTGGLVREPDPTILLDDRVFHRPASATFSAQQGLSSETILAIMQDREGNIWTATSKGLDRFRRTPLTPVKLPRRALSFAMAPAADGAVWAANWQGGLMKVSDQDIVEFPEVGPGTRFLYTAPDGALWSGGGRGLWRSADARQFEKFPVEQSFIANRLLTMAIDGQGDIWITGGDNTVTARVSKGVWSYPTQAQGFPDKWAAACLIHDAVGRVWGCAGNDALLVEGGKARRLSAMAPGLDIGQVGVLHLHGQRLWLGGHAGLAVFDGHRVINLRRRDGIPFENLGGVVEVASGDVWLHDRSSAMRIPAAEVQRALSTAQAAKASEAAVDLEVMEELDGMYGTVSNTSPVPSLMQGSDGRLWFASDAGLAWLDPITYARPKRVAPVSIRSLVADGTHFALDTAPQLAPRNRRVELSYAATALSTPERLRFRYRLQGLTTDWQDAGARRTAYFNDLPPGRYRFEVEASDEYGAWSGQQASLDFQVAPAWYQTMWFRAGCAALALVALWGALRLRERQIARQITAREEAKQAERNRIARDLHDTFLQSVQGLMYQFQALSARIPGQDPVRAQLDKALDLADRVVAEGRDRVVGLRLSGQGPLLSDQLRAVWTDGAGDGVGDGAPTLELRVQGPELPLKASVSDEAIQILREALLNVRQHAHASQVSIELHYSLDRGFRALVSDNGTGMPASVLDHGKPGHWGLAGMKERAAVIGGALSIRSGAAVGTQVELSLPPALAFELDD